MAVGLRRSALYRTVESRADRAEATQDQLQARLAAAAEQISELAPVAVMLARQLRAAFHLLGAARGVAERYGVPMGKDDRGKPGPVARTATAAIDAVWDLMQWAGSTAVASGAIATEPSEFGGGADARAAADEPHACACQPCWCPLQPVPRIPAATSRLDRARRSAAREAVPLVLVAAAVRGVGARLLGSDSVRRDGRLPTLEPATAIPRAGGDRTTDSGMRSMTWLHAGVAAGRRRNAVA